MKFTVFHVIDTCKDRGAGSLMENCRSFGTGQGAIEKQHTGATTGVALIEADDEQSVVRQGLFVGLHPIITAEVCKARSVATALTHEEVVRQGIALFLIYEACREVGNVEPGKVGFKPTGVNSGKNYPLAILQGAINLISSGYPGISHQRGEAFSVENEDQTKGSGKLQIHFS